MGLKRSPHCKASRSYKAHRETCAKLLIDLFFYFVVSSRVHQWQQMVRTREKFHLKELSRVESNPCVDSASETEAVYYLPSCIKAQFVDKLPRNLIPEKHDVFKIKVNKTVKWKNKKI